MSGLTAERGSPPQRGTWVVLGRGFIGSALTAHLRTCGIAVRNLPSPRLFAQPWSDPESLVSQARSHPAVAALAKELAGADCVVLAAGIAQPDAPATSALIGANALLPGVVIAASRQQAVPRVIHMSSAAVQGRRRVLTETPEVAPFSAYSRSKALGETVFTSLISEPVNGVLIRATSVQGPTRRTTESLRRVARSCVSSVARPGDQPSAVSSVLGLCRFVHHVGSWPEPVPCVVLQPWEGLSVEDVLEIAGKRQPLRLPRWLCHAAVQAGYGLSRLPGGPADGLVRRVEAMWFGQRVQSEWASRTGFTTDQEAARAALHGI